MFEGKIEYSELIQRRTAFIENVWKYFKIYDN